MGQSAGEGSRRDVLQDTRVLSSSFITHEKQPICFSSATSSQLHPVATFKGSNPVFLLNWYLYLKSLKSKMINTSYLSVPYFNQVIKQGPELQVMGSTTSEGSFCDSGGQVAMLTHVTSVWTNERGIPSVWGDTFKVSFKQSSLEQVLCWLLILRDLNI